MYASLTREQVLSKVLNAPFDFIFQLALLSSELRDIFRSAPPILTPEEARKRRKPESDDCQICFSSLRARPVVWCRAGCGQSLHEACLAKWALTLDDDVTCPFCRQEWLDGDEMDGELVERVNGSTVAVHEGYVNVAAVLGTRLARGTCIGEFDDGEGADE